MERNRIEELLAKVGDLTKDEKDEIKNAAKEAGLKVSFKSGCKDCYKDALVMLAAEGRKAGTAVKRPDITDEPWDNIVLEKRKGSPTMRTYKNGAWLEVDETTERGMAHLRKLWEGKHQRTVLMFYKASKKAEVTTETAEEGKEVDDGSNS